MFAASLLGLCLTPLTLYVAKQTLLPSRPPVGTAKLLARKDRVPTPIVQQQQRAKRSTYKLAMLAVGWAVFAYIVYLIWITPVEKPKVWNPWEILGISEGATPKEIKQAHKKLSMLYHPDKADPAHAEEAAKKYIDVSKAKLVLTDEEEYKKWEESGNPDGSQGMRVGIALPTWIVSTTSSPFVMMFYLLLFGIVPPYYIAKWWYSSSRVTKDGVLKTSMAKFFRGLREKISMRDTIEVLAGADEFATQPEYIYKEDVDEPALSNLAERVQKVLVEESGLRLEGAKDRLSPTAYKMLVFLYAHFYRVSISHEPHIEQQLMAVVKCAYLIQGMITISTTHGWYKCTAQLVDLSAMLVQGVPQNASSLLAIPHSTLDTPKRAKKQTPPIYNLRQFLAASDESRKSILGSELSEEQVEESVKVCKEIPQLEIVRAFFKVIGDEVVTPLAIVTLVARLRIANHPSIVSNSNKGDDDAADLDDAVGDMDEVERLLARQRGVNSGVTLASEVYSPKFAVPKHALWHMFLVEPKSGKLVIPMQKITDLVTEKVIKIQFQAPPATGQFDFKLVFKSDSLPGADVSMSIPLVIADPAQLPEENYDDAYDDISDAEPDSIAGQMAQMRGQAGAHEDDDSDDE
ncbi:DnaJ-domain-containing protein [Ramicandelaber brevisporus]|nr:DnaJ-domain-containing protein [Ramicandelaber brevisporus]